ncbi:uncharacterized protein TRUGW13939_01557 [Talaromyces rugulosus]|uniref:Uncharacterized protein n=1 Tax=Talaromyces rugulosus TaxID=121627 RepID=A0A7H8QKJ2_TALRU|nr:uncharacterized protein TRUGW13939_01557 [Talaromyces rugulosus]QKX54470.1 hypothetical protein TRUGW13939_01557 [Talaromyces rugulosus]
MTSRQSTSAPASAAGCSNVAVTPARNSATKARAIHVGKLYSKRFLVTADALFYIRPSHVALGHLHVDMIVNDQSLVIIRKHLTTATRMMKSVPNARFSPKSPVFAAKSC